MLINKGIKFLILILQFSFIYSAQNNGTVWKKIQKKVKNAVVQLFVQNSEFNWVEPYKSPEQYESYGTGFFRDKDGYIVTNFHVIEEASSIQIQVPVLGKDRLDCEVVGICPDRDLALLKLKKDCLKKLRDKLGNITYLELGNSDDVFSTQEILVLGYPLGQEKIKSTQGIISGREQIESDSYIQITAPLNDGNSGGPCMDLNGNVIGISTASFSDSQGIGYIIPVNEIKNVIKDLYDVKFLRKPVFGASFNFATNDMLDFLKNPFPGGLYVSRVYKDFLFYKSGIKSGDMIYKINGNNIDMYGEISVDWSEDKVSIFDLLNRFNIGQKIDIELYRNGKREDFSFNFDLVNELPIKEYYPPYNKVDYEIIGGMVLMELSLNNIRKLKTYNSDLLEYEKIEKRYKSRLILTHIFPGSQTKKARVLYVGDIISEINGKKVETLRDFRAIILASKKSKYITVKTKIQTFMILSLEKVLKDENKLAKHFFYKKSDLIKRLA